MKDSRLLFTKDELPTWNEFHEFILRGNFKFDNKTDTEIDPYWKYPSQLMKLAWTCNQLNKILFDTNVQNMSFWLVDDIFIDIAPGYFSLMEKKNKDFENVRFLIYHCINPTTRKYSEFITNNCCRYDIEEFFYKDKISVELKLFLNATNEVINLRQPLYKYFFGPSTDEFIHVVNQLTAEVKSYYKDPIGWKE